MNPMKKKTVRILFCVLLVAVLVSAFSMTAFAAGDVAGAIENTWKAAKSQIQTVVNNVVFPVCDMILSAIGDTIDFIGSGVGDAIWNAMLKWLYEIIYGAIADFFEMMGNMGSEVFDLEWVQATVKLFTLFGWGLFVAGTVVAVFDVAIEYQCGRANIKTTALNILKGFFACSLIGIVPIELYKFCISLQNTFSHDLVGIASGGINESLADAGLAALAGMFSSAVSATYGLLNLLCMIAFAYCVIKMFFANIKRGGILIIQIAVGSLYMFSGSPWLCGRLQSMVQAGYSDLPYGIYADNLVVPWTNDIPEQYAVGAWHYAGRQ